MNVNGTANSCTIPGIKKQYYRRNSNAEDSMHRYVLVHKSPIILNISKNVSISEF
jgi:hypothetical protein